MRVKRPILADLSAQPERLAVGREQQFDGRRIEPDAVVERSNLMSLVDSADHQHADQDLQLVDLARVARKERLDREGLVGFDDDVDPRRRNVDARQLVHDLVDLDNDDSIVKRGRLDDHRRVLGIRARVNVALLVTLLGTHQHDIRRKIHEQPGVELDIGMNSSNGEFSILEQLRQPQALRAGEGEVHFTGNAELE
jgi:hypothetical protein